MVTQPPQLNHRHPGEPIFLYDPYTCNNWSCIVWRPKWQISIFILHVATRMLLQGTTQEIKELGHILDHLCNLFMIDFVWIITKEKLLSYVSSCSVFFCFVLFSLSTLGKKKKKTPWNFIFTYVYIWY